MMNQQKRFTQKQSVSHDYYSHQHKARIDVKSKGRRETSKFESSKTMARMLLLVLTAMMLLSVPFSNACLFGDGVFGEDLVVHRMDELRILGRSDVGKVVLPQSLE